MELPSGLTKVTPLSKFLSIITFLTVPFIAFFSGIDYHQFITSIPLSDVEAPNYRPFPTEILSSQSSLNLQTPIAVGDTKTFTSQKLRISFSYDQTVPKSNIKTTVNEKGNIVYINQQGDMNKSQYVEVFEKDPNKSLRQTLEDTYLKNISPLDCFINDINGSYPGTLDVATLSFNKNNPNNSLKNAERCPKPYTEVVGLAFFAMDKDHPDRYAFFSIKQDSILTNIKLYNGGVIKGVPWQQTFRFF